MSIDEPMIPGDPAATDAPEPDLSQTEVSPSDVGALVDTSGAPADAEPAVTDAMYTGPEQNVVTELPVQTDPALITTVEEVRSSPAYSQWQAAQPGDTTIGDVSDADFWFLQSTDFTCGPAAATQIVEDFTGEPLPNEIEISILAAEEGLLMEDGMTAEGLATVLTEAGVPAEVLHDQTWEDVARYLDEGRSVVMMVDSGDYWPGAQDASEGVDHFVRIVAIDTERGVAILSDSGHPDGQQLEVPLEALDEAWSSRNIDAEGNVGTDRLLIVSEQPDPTPDEAPADPFAEVQGGPVGDDPFAAAGTAEPGRTDGPFSNPAGWVIVPVELAASRIFASVPG